MVTEVAPERVGRQPHEVPLPAGDVEFLGPYDGSGFRHPRFLVRRADGQVAQLPSLLYLVARNSDGRRDLTELAEMVGREVGRDLTPEEVGHLVDDRLHPARLVSLPDRSRAGGDGGDTRAPASGSAPRGDHLMMFRLRTALVPESAVYRIAGPLRALFHPLAVVVLLPVFFVVDAVIVTRHGWDALLRTGQALTATPALTLLVLLAIVVAGAFHEVGHVTACRYGGARPGSMGVGIYVVWPAFYSTVTDAYRLSRAGRLRTDLGGVYFNAILLTAAGGVYLATGWPWLLAFAAFWHLETAWQFLPSLRLDGYYVLADLVGVPDLFNRIRPVLRGAVSRVLRRRHDDDPLVADLKPWVRRVVTTWVLLVVPFLLYWVVLFAVLAPQLAPAAWRSVSDLGRSVADATADGRIVTAAAAVASILLLALPWMAGTYLVALQLRRLARWIARLLRRSGAQRGPLTTGRFAAAAAVLLVLGAGVGASGSDLLARTAAPAGRTTLTAGSTALPDGPPTLYGRVTEVIDPASMVVDVGGTAVTVHLLGVDAEALPDCARPGAIAFAQDRLIDRTVTLIPDPTLPAPERTASSWPAYAVLESQQSYTDLAISAGWARPGDGRYRPGAVAAEDSARRAGTGMWGTACTR